MNQVNGSFHQFRSRLKWTYDKCAGPPFTNPALIPPRQDPNSVVPMWVGLPRSLSSLTLLVCYALSNSKAWSQPGLA